MSLLGIAVMYYNGEKISIEHGSIFPNMAILDYNLLKTLPSYQKKSTLLDSLCQAIESYWSIGATNDSKKYSKQCISLILKNYKDYIENKYGSYKEIIEASNYSGKAINISKTTKGGRGLWIKAIKKELYNIAQNKSFVQKEIGVKYRIPD